MNLKGRKKRIKKYFLKTLLYFRMIRRVPLETLRTRMTRGMETFPQHNF